MFCFDAAQSRNEVDMLELVFFGRQPTHLHLTLETIPYNPGRDASYMQRLLAGGTAGGMGISVLNPMEVIKTQIQASKVKTPFMVRI